MKLYNVSNLNGLFQFLDTCSGNVRVETPDGKIYRWGTEDSSLLRSVAGSLSSVNSQGISLSFENKKDMTRVLIWAMEDACWPALPEAVHAA